MKPRLYTASKLDHAPMWKELRSAWPEVVFTARWIDHHLDAEFDPAICCRFWEEDEEDIRKSEALVVYAKPEDKLRGALVEAGIAIALGITVYVIGEHKDFGTWQYHPYVYRLASFDELRSRLL